MTQPAAPNVGSHSLAELSHQALGERLRAIPALARVSPSCLDGLAETGQLRTFRRGTEVLTEGGRSTSFFIVLVGQLKMCRALPTGRSVILALFGPGDLFGEAAALGGQANHGSIVAVEPVQCLEVRRDRLFSLFAAQPPVVDELLPILARPLVECRNCIVEMTCYRIETRLALLLLKLADTMGQSQDGATFLPIRLSRQELADMTGTTIETTIRVMSRWGKEGVVETRKDGFLLRDSATLKRFAQG